MLLDIATPGVPNSLCAGIVVGLMAVLCLIGVFVVARRGRGGK